MTPDTAMEIADPAAIAELPLTYEQARALTASPDAEVRAALARRTDVVPEILYYLARTPEPQVRLAVAANPGAPAKANLLLADDADGGVRAALAAKLAELERRGSGPAGKSGRSITHEVLDRLSRDRMSMVRAALAEGLKDVAGIPPELVRRLARDLEILVAAPVLEYSPVLSDPDLIEVIRSSPIEGVLAAISRRRYIDPAVTAAIVESRDPRAITHLLYNANAHLQESALDSLIAQAEEQPDWHAPLVHRPELAQVSVRRLAEIVAEHLLRCLVDRNDLSPEAARQVSEVVQARLQKQADEPELPTPFGRDTGERFVPFLERARALHEAGRLDDTLLMTALLTDHADELLAGLAVRSGLPVLVVLDIIGSQAPWPICALSWAAGLTARFAFELQVKLGRIAIDSAIRPAGDGGYLPSEAEMRWQIEMYADS